MVFLLATSLSCAKEKVKEVPTPSGKVVKTIVEEMWLEDYDLALTKAKAENKVVLINFTGSDWCKWCIKLVDEVFSKPEFAAYAKENLVLLKIDFPTTFQKLPEAEQMKRNELQKKYGVQGYPTILLVNSKGDTIGQTGYQQGGPVKYNEHLEAMIIKSKVK